MPESPEVPLLVLPVPMPLLLAGVLMRLIGTALADADTHVRPTATGAYEVLTRRPVAEVVAVVEAATKRFSELNVPDRQEDGDE